MGPCWPSGPPSPQAAQGGFDYFKWVVMPAKLSRVQVEALPLPGEVWRGQRPLQFFFYYFLPGRSFEIPAAVASSQADAFTLKYHPSTASAANFHHGPNEATATSSQLKTGWCSR